MTTAEILSKRILEHGRSLQIAEAGPDVHEAIWIRAQRAEAIEIADALGLAAEVDEILAEIEREIADALGSGAGVN